MKKEDLALSYKGMGMNCCQSVLLAFKDELGLPEEMLMKLGSGFGTGMGGMEGTCGALCGAVMVESLQNDTEFPTKRISKEMVQAFKSEAGAVSCEDLKGVKTHRMLCSCPDCVRYAVRIAEEGVPEIVAELRENQE